MLIRQHRCAGWSVSLMFANPKNRLSCVKAKMKAEHSDLKSILLAIYAIKLYKQMREQTIIVVSDRKMVKKFGNKK